MLRKIGRLTVFLLVFMALTGYVQYRQARASVVERLLSFGRRMAPYLDDAKTTEAPRVLRLNGIKLYVASGQTDHPPAWVRDFYQQKYADKADAPKQKLAFGGEQEGGVAVFEWKAGSLVDHIASFARSNDLGELLGELRYVYYRNEGRGTRFLTLWTDEHLALDKLARETGDAEGFDLPDVPRYPGTARVLSAAEEGAPGQTVVYVGGGGALAAEQFFEAQMPSRGWSEDVAFAKVARSSGRRALRFERKGGREVVLEINDSSDGELVISALQLR